MNYSLFQMYKKHKIVTAAVYCYLNYDVIYHGPGAVPPGPFMTWAWYHLGLVPTSTWAWFYLGLVPPGSGTTWGWFHLDLIPPGSGSTWAWYHLGWVPLGPGTTWAWFHLGLWVMQNGVYMKGAFSLDLILYYYVSVMGSLHSSLCGEYSKHADNSLKPQYVLSLFQSS